MSITAQDISNAAAATALSGSPLCVHSSLSSFGHVAGGAQSVVDGLLVQGCTVMVPSFSHVYAVPPPLDQRPPRNGLDYSRAREVHATGDAVYTPDSGEIDGDMGAIPAAVVATPARARGNHPLCSFATTGPLANELVAGQRPLDVYAPFRELARRGGYVVMMGVDLTRMTALHLAERMAGRNLFRRSANGPDGSPAQVEGGGCSNGFNRLEPTLAPIERQVTVGDSLWRIFRAAEVLERASRAIREEPAITHCDNPDCRHCNDAVAGGPILEGTGVGPS